MLKRGLIAFAALAALPQVAAADVASWVHWAPVQYPVTVQTVGPVGFYGVTDYGTRVFIPQREKILINGQLADPAQVQVGAAATVIVPGGQGELLTNVDGVVTLTTPSGVIYVPLEYLPLEPSAVAAATARRVAVAQATNPAPASYDGGASSSGSYDASTTYTSAPVASYVPTPVYDPVGYNAPGYSGFGYTPSYGYGGVAYYTTDYDSDDSPDYYAPQVAPLPLFAPVAYSQPTLDIGVPFGDGAFLSAGIPLGSPDYGYVSPYGYSPYAYAPYGLSTGVSLQIGDVAIGLGAAPLIGGYYGPGYAPYWGGGGYYGGGYYGGG